jgi:surface polysaccharide O-acyltransferase-like enzyme
MSSTATETDARRTSGAEAAPRTDREAAPRAGRADAPERAYRPVLDVLRVAAICAVVLIHTVGGLASTDGTSTPGWYAAAILDVTAGWAVPVFVMLSGALLLRDGTFRHGTGPYLARRAGRILPALVLWTGVYEIANVLQGDAGTRDDLLLRLLDGTTQSHLYFLWLIGGLYVVAPALQVLLAPGGARRAWVLGGVAAAWTTLVVVGVPQARAALTGDEQTVRLSVLTMFLPWVGYFVLGRAVVLSRPSRAIGIALLLLATAIQIGTAIHYVTLPEPRGDYFAAPPRSFRPAEVVAAVALFTGIWALARDWRAGERTEHVLRSLGRATFGVFLVHHLIIDVLEAVVPGAEAVPQRFPSLVLIAVAAIVLSFAASFVLARVPVLRRAV